jgi:excisionase family DNA binding protein
MVSSSQDSPRPRRKGERPAAALRLGDAARLLGVSTITLRRWANEGKVASFRSPGGQRRFRREDLQAVHRMERRTKRWGSRQHDKGRGELSAGALREQMLAELVELGTLSAQTRDIDYLLQTVAERLLTTLRLANVDIYRKHDDGTLSCVMSVDRFGRDTAAECGSFETRWFGPNSRAVQTQDIVVVRGPADPILTRDDLDIYRRFGYASEVCVPLVASNDMVGLIEVYDERPRDYAKELDFLKSVGRIVGGAFEAALLMDKLDRSNQDLRLLVQSGLEFGGSLDLDEVLRTVALRMCSVAGTPACDIHSLQGDVLCAVIAVEDAQVDPTFAGTRYPLADNNLSMLAVEGREPVTVIDIETDDRLSEAERQDYRDWGLRSTLILPLIAGGKVLGTADLFDREPRQYERVELLFGLAAQAAQAIHNAELHRRLTQHEKRLASLLESSRTMTSTLTTIDFLDSLVHALATALDSDECVIFEYDEASESLISAALYQSTPGYTGQLGEVFPIADTPVERELLRSGDLLVETISDPNLDSESRASMERWGEKTCLNVPLFFQGKPLGVLVVIETQRERAYTEEELELARGFSEQAAVALHAARLIRGLQEQNEELERRTRLLALASECSTALASQSDLGAVLRATAERICVAFDAPNCDVYVLDDESTVECVASVVGGKPDTAWVGRRFATGEWAPWRLVNDARRPVFMKRDDECLAGPALDSMREYGEACGLAAPLSVGGAIVGLVEVYDGRPERRFTEDEIVLLDGVCRVAALAIQNAQLLQRERDRSQAEECAAGADRAAIPGAGALPT